MLLLPPGPGQNRLAQTVMLSRDPLGVLRQLRSRFGPVFTIRTTNGPMVVVGAAAAFRDPDTFVVADRFAEGAFGPFFPYGGRARACVGRHLAQAEIRTAVPAVLATRRIRPLAREPERLVERATILTPRRGALVTAS